MNRLMSEVKKIKSKKGAVPADGEGGGGGRKSWIDQAVGAPPKSFRSFVQEHGHVVYRRMRVVGKNGVTVRSGIEVSSAKVGELAFDCDVEVTKEAASEDGRERIYIKSLSAERGAPAIAGWVSQVTASGSSLLEVRCGRYFTFLLCTRQCIHR